MRQASRGLGRFWRERLPQVWEAEVRPGEEGGPAGLAASGRGQTKEACAGPSSSQPGTQLIPASLSLVVCTLNLHRRLETSAGPGRLLHRPNSASPAVPCRRLTSRGPGV